MEELKNNIIRRLTEYKDSWSQLSGTENDALRNRITAMQIAINIVNKEFKKLGD
jgi:hypothetical protein